MQLQRDGVRPIGNPLHRAHHAYHSRDFNYACRDQPAAIEPGAHCYDHDYTRRTATGSRLPPAEG